MHCGENGSQIMAQMAKHLHIITTYIEYVFTNNQSDENTKSHKLQLLVNESQIHLKTDYYKHFKYQKKTTTNIHTRSYIHTIHTLTLTQTHIQNPIYNSNGGKNG